jgi:hypothetical protein
MVLGITGSSSLFSIGIARCQICLSEEVVLCARLLIFESKESSNGRSRVMSLFVQGKELVSLIISEEASSARTV